MKKWTDAAGLWQYTYDGNGESRTLQVGSGEVTTYVYDAQGRLAQVQAGSRAFIYAYTGGNSVPDTLTRPNGSVSYYTYDNLYRLKDIANKTSGGAIINENAYVYDKAHMRTQETVTNGNLFNAGAGFVSYSYNNVNQITNTGYSYDADGNMTAWTANGVSYSATYDAENRLKTVSYTGHNATFTYNGDGFMSKQVVDGVETRFVRYLNFNVLQERDASNNVSRSYVWDEISPGGIGGLLELTTGGQHYDYLYDGKGNVSAVIDANQNVAAAYKYDGFGKLLSKTGTFDQLYQFSTKRYYAFGGYDYGYRFYLPIIGKWMTRDPKGEKGGINLYRFNRNNSLRWVDKFGLNPGDYFSTFEEAAIDATRYAYRKLEDDNIQSNSYINREYNWNYYKKGLCGKFKFTYDEPNPGDPYKQGDTSMVSFPPPQDPSLGEWYGFGHIHGWYEPNIVQEEVSTEDQLSNTKKPNGGRVSMVPSDYPYPYAPGTVGTPSGNIIKYYHDGSRWQQQLIGTW